MVVKKLASPLVLFLAALCVGAFFVSKNVLFTKEKPQMQPGGDASAVSDEDHNPEDSEPNATTVTTTYPQSGVVERVVVQPGTIQAYEFVQMYSKVSGFLKSQKVDIGDRVKKDQILAEVDIPELEKMVERNEAALEQAQAKVDQVKARLATAKAELEAAKANITHVEAQAKSAAAWVRFRTKQHARMKDLFALKSIDERLVDESQERLEAAIETERSAGAGIITAQAQIAAMNAKVLQAQSDIVAAQAEVRVARADLERSQVQKNFGILRAPFDGVITHRNLFPGDYVRAANEGSPPPLLTVQRTDRMRVVVQVPDRDVPFVDVGDPATVQVDALPEQQMEAEVSRLSHTEDPTTRLMQIEIDVPNPQRKLRQGMYGKVTLVLERASGQLAIPSSCLIGRTQDGKGSVFVVRDGKAKLTPVQLGLDNGILVAIRDGLAAEDTLIVRPPSNLQDGSEVVPILAHRSASSR